MKFPKIPGFHGVCQATPNTAEMQHFNGRQLQVLWGKEKKGNAKAYTLLCRKATCNL